jgi:hypothetical protein
MWMKYLSKVLVIMMLVLGALTPVSAEYGEYLYQGSLFTKSDRAYLLKRESGDSVVIAYSFPELVEIKRILLPSDLSWVIVLDQGLIVNTSTYADTQVERVEDGKKKTYMISQVLTHYDTYDLNLNYKSSMDLQDEYEYEIYDYDAEYLNTTKAKKKSKKTSSQCTFKKLKNGKLQML